MTIKVLLTGASGYIGGAALDAVYKAHPDYEYALLVRDEERAKPIKAKYPDAKFLYGTLEDSDLVRDAALDADIVIHTGESADNVPGVIAIGKGLEEGHTNEKPGYWIHVSGTAILNWYDTEHKRYGEAPLSEESYHDVNDISRLLAMPEDAPHRNVDQMVQETASDAVRVAIVCPPTIYDKGNGTINTTSKQVPAMVRMTLLNGFAPIIGAGKTEWDHVNISDLSALILGLVDATQDSSKQKDAEIFGLNAYYFAESGSHKWADVAQWIADECHRQGYIAEAATKNITLEEAAAMKGSTGGRTYGLNSKGKAERASRYLGWKPQARSLQASIADLVKEQAQQLNLKSI